jgi:hypothetical protein
MYIMLLFIGSILITIIYNKTNRICSVDPPCDIVDTLPTNKKMIVFSAGGGYWPYYLGIAKYIKEHYDLSDVCLVGTSAGGLSILALLLRNNVDVSMKACLGVTIVLSQHILGLFSLQWCGLYKEQIMYHDYDSHIPSFIAVSKVSWFGLKKRYFLVNSDTEAIADAAIASCWLPYITAPFFQPFYYIGGSYYFDGFFTGKDNINKENSIIIYPWRFAKLPFYTYLLWLDPDYNMSLYRLGYEHASKNKDAFAILTSKQ